MSLKAILSGVFFVPIRLTTSKNSPPSMPLEKANNAEESGIYRLTTPTVQNMSIDDTKTPRDLLLFDFSMGLFHRI